MTPQNPPHPAMAKPRCFDCKFAVAESDYEFECRRNPPVPVQSDRYVRACAWPVVKAGMWCGEFRLRKAETKA